MPRISAETYTPRGDEPAMMSMEAREAACAAYYAEMEAAGRGTVADFGEGVRWFIPSNFDDLGADLAGVITARQPNPDLLATLLSATFVRLGDRVKADVLAAVPAEPHPATPAPVTLPIGDAGLFITDRLAAEGFSFATGFAASSSQFGERYVTLYNGVTVAEGTRLPPAAESVEIAVEQTIAGIKALAGAHRRIVWRNRPERLNTPAGHTIRCRLHSMEAQS